MRIISNRTNYFSESRSDFAGYSFMALGVGKLMGFDLINNFERPYLANSITEFWKRWHISLSRWLQEYLYIPLGGNRKATFGTYFWIITMALIAVALSRSIWLFVGVALILLLSLWFTRNNADERRKLTTNLNSLNTMLLGGLWHGASLNFVIWGGLNGLGVIIYKTWKNFNYC